jgi:hypothetical protein
MEKGMGWKSSLMGGSQKRGKDEKLVAVEIKNPEAGKEGTQGIKTAQNGGGRGGREK